MRKLVVGNLKMNLISPSQRNEYFENYQKELNSVQNQKTNVVLCVPAIHVEAFVRSKLAEIGGQNLFWQEAGSYTGEISASMLKNFGAAYVIIGHSERRKYFDETNKDANLKIKAALQNKLIPIYCVGESLEERTQGVAADVISKQITEAFADIVAQQATEIVIAYEPVWAVGSDRVPTSDEILEIKILLKKIFAEMYGLNVAEKIQVLYGGSVKAELVKQVCLEPEMDGVLVGRESLTPGDFFKIVKELEK